MGDWFQVVVDRDATVEEAPALADKVRTWLISEGIIEAKQTECVLSSERLGYPPGPRFEKIFGTHGNAALECWANGLDIMVGRGVFCAPESYKLRCRRCKELHHCTAFGEALFEAIGEWYHKRSEGNVACPRCAHTEPVTEWEFEPAVGFGNLGFEFWNWPSLKKSFVSALSKQLGHRTVVVAGKL